MRQCNAVRLRLNAADMSAARKKDKGNSNAYFLNGKLWLSLAPSPGIGYGYHLFIVSGGENYNAGTP